MIVAGGQWDIAVVGGRDKRVASRGKESAQKWINVLRICSGFLSLPNYYYLIRHGRLAERDITCTLCTRVATSLSAKQWSGEQQKPA